MKKLALLLSILTTLVLSFSYIFISTTNTKATTETKLENKIENKENPPVNLITLDKESQLLFKLRTTPATNKIINNGFQVPATIKLRPQSQATISSSVTGLLKMKRIITVGDLVKKDEVIATVQQPLNVADQITLDAYQIEQRSRRIKVEDDVDHTRKLLVIANVELTRVKKLYEAGATSLKRLQEAEQKVEFASIEAAHAIRNLIDLGQKDKNFDSNLTIKSPLTGIVASLNATNGEQVESGKTLLTIVDLSNVWVEAQIFENDLPKLYNATNINYQIPAIDSKINTLPVRTNFFNLATNVNPTTRMVAVYFEIPNPENKLIDGLIVKLDINSSEKIERLTVPTQAIIIENEQKIVFVYKGGEQFEKRVITTGIETEENTEILTGLSLGERVVVEGIYQLRAKK
ncbi:MAG: efflux RND transporter periplasmic adaptor subunit [Blastocatellia bacterium]|nr:efflux RND transporter periplasmic adaptor subunit [Blastocatellia bacterium]